MALQPRMADSVEPLEIPQLFKKSPNGVAAYHDGPHAWPPAVLAEFPRCWRISVTGDLERAREARVLDVETLDVPAEAVAPYQAERASHDEETVVYCDRSNVRPVVLATPAWPDLAWWIATLDDVNWTPAELAADLRDNFDVTIDPDKIRAIQNRPMGSYDQSSVWGNPRWSRG